MHDYSDRSPWRAFLIAVLAATFGAATLTLPPAAQAQVALTAPETATIVIEDVVNVVGFDGIRSNRGGRLVFSGQDIVLTAGDSTGVIPMKAVRAFEIERSTTSLMHGTKGKVAGFIPRGVGNLYHAIRRGAEVLTIYYADTNDALHGAVLLLPQKRNDDVLKAFASAGLSPSTALVVIPVDQPGFATDEAMPASARPSVRIALPRSSDVALPTAYTAAVYEELNAELIKSGLFDTVWRQGDLRAPADALTLTIQVKEFKKGNAGRRGAIPLFGMLLGKTLIKADLSLADASGGMLLEKEVKGSKRMSGESIGAAKSLARRVGASLAKVPGFTKAPPPSAIAAR